VKIIHPGKPTVRALPHSKNSKLKFEYIENHSSNLEKNEFPCILMNISLNPESMK
jgi:hypothetical protein